MAGHTDTRTFKLLDLPLMIRLHKNGMVLHSGMGLTRDARGQNSALLSRILFPRGLYTLVTRSDEQEVVGQFRYRQDDLNAHIVYIAPTLEATEEDTIWLHILDAMAREAGKHGAHHLIAEVEESSRLFETMRNAGFAVYSRQVIWHHDPLLHRLDLSPIELRPESSEDQEGIMSLLTSTIPTMLQSITAPSDDMQGFVYRKNGRIEAYIALREGKHGIYLIPYLHPDVMGEADTILEAAIRETGRAQKVPLYACIRGYQHWLEESMYRLGFAPWAEQAVMVKHLTAGIRSSNFSRVRLKGIAQSTIPPAVYITLNEHKEYNGTTHNRRHR